MASVVINGDTSGSVTLSAPAVAGSNTLTLPASTGTVLTTATAVTEAQGGTGTTTGYYGFKNRIINGAMVIDQRNAGASATPTTNGTYNIDRWYVTISQSSKLTVQQNASSVTPPAGFKNYLGITSTSAYSVLAGDYFGIAQAIEGLNTFDLGWGAAGASSVTLSFWVRSSLVGTFGGSILNSANNRSYPFSYTISSANTWEQKTITITGDTSGTWLTTNGIGIRVLFALGYGSTYGSGTSGAWTAGDVESVTGATSVVGTNGATFYITGVQLEKGSTATSFDYRPYGTELALCQRYYYKATVGGLINSTGAPAANQVDAQVWFPVTMRTTPTMDTNITAGTAGNPSGSNIAVYQSGYKSLTGSGAYALNGVSAVSATIYTTYFTITSGIACELIFGPTSYMGFNSEL
jgi:hypothetical protein